MKKIFVFMLSVGLALGASAQHGHFGGGFGGRTVVVVPRTYVGVGFGLGYPWGYPYGWYGPWYGAYPPYYYGYGAMPSQLELQIQDIRKDYDQQIKDVKHDKSLTRQERRSRVDQLKKDKENAIVDARHAYFNNWRQNNYRNQQPRNDNNNNNGNNNNSNGNGSSSDGPEYKSSQDSK